MRPCGRPGRRRTSPGSSSPATTRVSARYIQALEAEDWDVVPGSVIGRGFVRVLARDRREGPGPSGGAERPARGNRGPPTTPCPSRTGTWPCAPNAGARFLMVVGRPRGASLAGIWVLVPVDPVSGAVGCGRRARAPSARRQPRAPRRRAGPAAPSPSPPEAPACRCRPAAPCGLGVQAVEKVWVRVGLDGGEPVGSAAPTGERVESTRRGSPSSSSWATREGSRRLGRGAAPRVPGGPGEVKTLEPPGRPWRDCGRDPCRDATPGRRRGARSLGDSWPAAEVAVVLGSGLGGPPRPELSGPTARLRGRPRVGGVRRSRATTVCCGEPWTAPSLMVFQGRRHLYEGGADGPGGAAGAAGGAPGRHGCCCCSRRWDARTRNSRWASWVFVDDHLNLPGRNPLEGVGPTAGPPRSWT